MSQFTTNFKGELIGKNRWKNLETFEYHVGSYPSDEIITVPVGFDTDFASIPRIFWPIMSPVDLHAKAAVIHDYTYRNTLYTRKRCDDIFKEGMEVLNVELWKIWAMYICVRLFAGSVWNKKRKKEASV